MSGVGRLMGASHRATASRPQQRSRKKRGSVEVWSKLLRNYCARAVENGRRKNIARPLDPNTFSTTDWPKFVPLPTATAPDRFLPDPRTCYELLRPLSTKISTSYDPYRSLSTIIDHNYDLSTVSPQLRR